MLCPWGRTSRVFIYGGMCDRSMRSGTKLAREIQLTDWSTPRNLSNRSSGVQIPRDICTRFRRYLYSTRCSWIINPTNILSARTSVWESTAIQETEEENLTPESQQQSRRNIQINSVSQQSLNLSLHSAKRRHDILNLTVSMGYWASVRSRWVQMNVVPRSTGNTNSGTRELTLKCKLKCYFKPMNNPLGVSPSKGKQGTTRGKEKIFWPRWESNPRPTD